MSRCIHGIQLEYFCPYCSPGYDPQEQLTFEVSMVNRRKHTDPELGDIDKLAQELDDISLENKTDLEKAVFYIQREINARKKSNATEPATDSSK